MSARLLTSWTVIGRSGNAARSEGLEPPTVSSLLVHDPGGLAWIRHAIAANRDIFGEPNVKGGEGEWSWRPKTLRRGVEEERIVMSEFKRVDRYIGKEGAK